MIQYMPTCHASHTSRWRPSGRNDHGSSSVIRSSFATKISSNYIIWILNTTDLEPLQPISEAFSFCFLGQRSFVKIICNNSFDWLI